MAQKIWYTYFVHITITYVIRVFHIVVEYFLNFFNNKILAKMSVFYIFWEHYTCINTVHSVVIGEFAVVIYQYLDKQ